MKFFDNYIFPFNTLVCALGLCIIAYTTIILGWKPCPMCLLQQFCVLVIFVLGVIGWLKISSSKISVCLIALTLVVIIFGTYVAADQVYIQYFQQPIATSNVNSCGGIDNPFLLDATKSITGSVESCTDIKEKITGVSLAVYSLTFFIFMLITNGTSLITKLFKK